MANEYEHLGFSITSEDKASSALDSIISRLEKIKSLTANISGVFSKINFGGATSGGSSSFTQQAQDIANIVVNMKNLTAEQQRYIKALKAAAIAENNYEKAQNNRVSALNAQEQATDKLNQATAKLQSLQEKYGKLDRFDKEGKKGKSYLAQIQAAQNQVNSAQYSKLSADTRVENAVLSEANALNRLTQAREKLATFSDDVVNSFSTSATTAQQSTNAINNNTNAIQRNTTATQTQTTQTTQSTSTTQQNTTAVKNSTTANNNHTQSIQKNIKAGAKQLVSFAAITQIVKSLTSGIVSALNESGEFIENLNLFGVTFGSTYQQTLDWSLQLADNLGFASSEVVRFTGLFKQLATSIGIASDVGDEMSTTLTQLGYDLASFYNISTESSFEKLQAGIFSGQTKPLRALGLDVTYQTLDNVLKTEEAFASFGATSKSLDQAAKAQLRLYVVLKNSVNAWGDATKTIGTYENQLRVLQGSMSNFKLAIGDIFRDTFANVLVIINGIIQGITSVIRAFVPLETEVNNTSAAMQMFADDTEEATEAGTGGDLLDFDQFRTLGGGAGSASELASINDVISEQLGLQMNEYSQYMDTLMNTVSTKSKEIAEKIKNWFVDSNNELTGQAKGLAAVFAAIPIAALIKKFISLRDVVKSVEGNYDALTKSQNLFRLATSKTGLAVLGVSAIFIALLATNEEFRASVGELFNALLSLLSSVLEPLMNILNTILMPALQGVLDLLASILTPIINILTPIINIITALNDMTNGWLALGTILLTVVIIAFRKIIGLIWNVPVATLKAKTAIKDFGNTLSTTMQKATTRIALVVAGLSMIVDGAVSIATNWDNMSSWERASKIISVVAGVIFVLASAIATFHASWSLGAAIASIVAGVVAVGAAIGAAVSSAKSSAESVEEMANGGITDANFIMTNEYGKREWVGQMKNKTAVVNDTQMSKVMEISVARGVVRAMSVNNMTQEPITVTVNAVLDGETVYRNQQRVSAKHGKGYATKR